jgi:hypothetical protein
MHDDFARGRQWTALVPQGWLSWPEGETSASHFAMFHQFLHCQTRIVAHRLAGAFQQSSVPALRPGDGRGQPMSIRFRNAGQLNLGEAVHQRKQSL